jgi:hypothetical protein
MKRLISEQIKKATAVVLFNFRKSKNVFFYKNAKALKNNTIT